MSENTVKIHITGSGSELQGVGRLSDGRAVFVPGALPGEDVEIEITELKDRFAKGALKKVLTPSTDRVTPDCPYYGSCGGCAARHMNYDCALRLKREKVYNALTRIGGLKDPVVEDTLPSPLVSGYRNKAEFARDNGRVGVFEEGSHSVIDVDSCLLQDEKANALLGYLKANIGKLPVRYIVTRVNSACEVMLTLSLSYPTDISDLAKSVTEQFDFVKSVYACRLSLRPAHALDGPCTLVTGKETLTETLCGLTFSVSPRSFFQVNRLQAERLYDTAISMAGLTGTENVCDIYCGAGTISLCAAKSAAHVTGIEIVPDAIRDAKENAKHNHLPNTTFLCGDAAKLYPALSKKTPFDTVITDPPRAGMDKAVVDALLANPPKRIVYVSCDPGTLARDIKRLTTDGTFRMEKAVPADMFPGTHHVETVCSLVLRNAPVHIDIDVDVEELLQSKRGQATYAQIKQYVMEHTGLNVPNLYISQIKRKYGLDVGESYNKPKSDNPRIPQCPPEKEAAIEEAMKFYGIIDIPSSDSH